MDAQSADDRTRALIEGELSEDEELLWAGRPRQGILLQPVDIFLIPFSLLWGGFALFWEVSVLLIPKEAGPIGIIFQFFGIPFVLMGLYLIFGRFLHDSLRRKKTYYGVTDRRVVILSGIFDKNVKSLDIGTMNNITLTEKSSGGDIRFGDQMPWLQAMGWSVLPGIGPNAQGLEKIENARQVYDLILSRKHG